MPIPVAARSKLVLRPLDCWGSRVWIPLRAWIFLFCVCCVFCRQRSVLRDLQTSTMRQPGPSWILAPKTIKTVGLEVKVVAEWWNVYQCEASVSAALAKLCEWCIMSIRRATVINTCSCCVCVIGGCTVGYLVTFTTMQKLFRSIVIRGWWGSVSLEVWRGISRGYFSA
jgi:hypothetical protein